MLTRRVVDPVNGPLVVRIFELTAAGVTPGEIARTLNAEGVRDGREQGWRAPHDLRPDRQRGLRGQRGYPGSWTPTWRRVPASSASADPSAVQQRKGGRPADPAYVLRGLAFCACGAPLYCTSQVARRPARLRLPGDVIQ